MKNIVLATAFAAISTSAFAGNMEEPMMEMEVIAEVVEEASGSSGSLLIPALILLMVGLASGS